MVLPIWSNEETENTTFSDYFSSTTGYSEEFTEIWENSTESWENSESGESDETNIGKYYTVFYIITSDTPMDGVFTSEYGIYVIFAGAIVGGVLAIACFGTIGAGLTWMFIRR